MAMVIDAECPYFNPHACDRIVVWRKLRAPPPLLTGSPCDVSVRCETLRSMKFDPLVLVSGR